MTTPPTGPQEPQSPDTSQESAAAIPDRVSGFFRETLGFFGKGVGTISDALRSMDGAVHQVDGALTGGRGPSPPPMPVAPDQVAALIRQGAAAADAEGLGSPSAVSHFQEVLRLAGQSTSVAARALRGSIALSRLAGGTGTLEDLAAVQAAADQLLGVIHHVSPPPSEPGPEPEPERPRSRRRRRARRAPEERPETPQAEEAAQPAPAPAPATLEQSRHEAVLLAEEVAREIDNRDVYQWARDFRDGKIEEEWWLNSVSWWCADNNKDINGLVERALPRAIQRRDAGE